MEFFILAAIILIAYFAWEAFKKGRDHKKSVERANFLRDRYGAPKEHFDDLIEDSEFDQSEINDEEDIFHGQPDVPNYGTKRKPSEASLARKKINKENLLPHEDADPGSFFYGKKVVFTGNMDIFDRDLAANYVASMGGDVNTSISGKTDFVIVGSNPGKVKIQKVKDLNASGKNIQFLNEYQFEEIIDNYEKKASE